MNLTRMSMVSANWSDLHYSVLFSRPEEIQRLVESGVDIDLKTDYGETPLHIACYLGDFNCVRTILKYKPSMNVADTYFHNTPLLTFIQYMNYDDNILNMFLENGADPNIPQTDGNTALHLIAKTIENKRGNGEKYARTLIKFKADVNSRNLNGNTPLHIAIKRGFTGMIKILLENGANLCIKNRSGNTPIHWAFYNEKMFPEVLEEIGKHIIIQFSCKKLVNSRVLNDLCKISGLKDFKDKCDKELPELKCRITERSFVTYYHLLVSPLEITAKYLRNKDILTSAMAFDNPKCIFGSQLKQILRDSVERNEAIEIAYKFSRKVFPVILPDSCLDEVFKYLSNSDISQLKKVTSF